MQIQEVDVFIAPDGTVSYEVHGLKGKRCLDLTKELEMDLGGDILLREETSEMYEVEVRDQQDNHLATGS